MKQKRAIDSAKEFRERVLKKWQEESAPWPLSGLKQFPCEREIYLSLKPKETPNQLFRAVDNHWKELYQTHGKEMAGIGNMISLIVAPNGEAFCSFRIARYPGMVGETEDMMIPRVDKTVALFEAYAKHDGRLTATIEGEQEIVCSDSRRFLLNECDCVNMMTSEIAKTFKIFKQRS
jgi:hypothetical protein